jgi:hypothetical protein
VKGIGPHLKRWPKTPFDRLHKSAVLLNANFSIQYGGVMNAAAAWIYGCREGQPTCRNQHLLLLQRDLIALPDDSTKDRQAMLFASKKSRTLGRSDTDHGAIGGSRSGEAAHRLCLCGRPALRVDLRSNPNELAWIKEQGK